MSHFSWHCRHLCRFQHILVEVFTGGSLQMRGVLTPQQTANNVYHPGQNGYRCKSLINSKTISVSKKITELFLQDSLIPKT